MKPIHRLGWAIGFLASSTLFASASEAAGPGMTTSFTIKGMTAREMGIEIVPSASISNPMGCANPSVVRVLTTASNYQAITSEVITAYAAGKPIALWVSACDTDGVPLAVAVYVNP